jgi:hypothetical protein
VLIITDQASDSEAQRMFSIVDDLRWYADRIGKERLDTMPRSNKWVSIRTYGDSQSK